MSPPHDDADLTSLDDEQRALLDAAFGVPAPDAGSIDTGVDAVMARLGDDDRHDLVRDAFVVRPPAASRRETSMATIMARVDPARPSGRQATPRSGWRAAWGLVLVAAVLLAGLGTWLLADRHDTDRALRGSYDRDQIEVRHIESPQGLVSVQKVSQEAARRIVQRVGGGGSDTARKATGRQLR